MKAFVLRALPCCYASHGADAVSCSCTLLPVLGIGTLLKQTREFLHSTKLVIVMQSTEPLAAQAAAIKPDADDRTASPINKAFASEAVNPVITAATIQYRDLSDGGEIAVLTKTINASPAKFS